MRWKSLLHVFCGPKQTQEVENETMNRTEIATSVGGFRTQATVRHCFQVMCVVRVRARALHPLRSQLFWRPLFLFDLCSFFRRHSCSASARRPQHRHQAGEHHVHHRSWYKRPLVYGGGYEPKAGVKVGTEAGWYRRVYDAGRCVLRPLLIHKRSRLTT